MNRPRLPAEWEPQSATQLTWPHPDTDWGPQLQRTLPVFAQIGAVISHDQLLLSVCRDQAHAEQARAWLARAGADPARLGFALCPSNDTWARDHGPIVTLLDDRPKLNDFVFDGWGGKFPAELDTQLTACLHAQGIFGEVPLASHPLVLEGGAIETDGQGTLLATRSSVLDEKRNPGLGSAQIEQQLRDILGLERFLWLDHGQLSGDDTDAHIDILARFADPQTLLHVSAPAHDPDHAELAAMREQLAEFRTAEGQPYRLLALPYAGELYAEDGRRLSASYANFLITPQSVLLPTYQVAADQAAIAVLQQAFPTRRIVPIDCRPLIEQNGSLHCLSMQYPAAMTFNLHASQTAL